jgi:hypothetical protein
MSLTSPTPPPEALDLVRSRLAIGPGRGGARMRYVDDASPEGLDLAAPHVVYTLNLDDIARGVGLESARPTTWRYLLVRGDRALASAEVYTQDDLGATGYAHTNEGQFVAETMEAIEVAEELPEVADGEYELRLLRIPALYLMALWLKDQVGDKDLLLPMRPSPTPISAHHAYVESALFEILRPLATKQLELASQTETDDEPPK